MENQNSCSSVKEKELYNPKKSFLFAVISFFVFIIFFALAGSFTKFALEESRGYSFLVIVCYLLGTVCFFVFIYFWFWFLSEFFANRVLVKLWDLPTKKRRKRHAKKQR
ncbi:hypothetical protein CM1_00360 [Mycoplasmoides genitalium M6320]|uniref:Transmembrane protein n=1 Tax=Mycoplasmoides genitalium M6320 TaxID=662945 RepID=A0ABC7ZIB7_MYCGT|nr:hypothetical protein [Mycoplasmoides genitalium]AFQ03864.1 hypothetical protein CM1_00360 [Mycoplasmoides genitalium M6320]